MICRPVALLLSCLSFGAPVSADDINLEGIIFSDQDSSIVLHEGWGQGTIDDPFTLVEDIVSDGPAILTIRGVRREFGNPAGFQHPIGFALTKIVRNLTKHPWQVFELELREVKDRMSDYEDGLSFAQANGNKRLYRSDRFTEAWQTDEPFDAITFSGAVIPPGETVVVEMIITDFSPNYEFYLFQRRESPLASLSPVRSLH